MNFRKKGWLKKYTDLRAALPLPVPVAENETGPDALERSLYRFLQPTGLLYGFPLEYPFPETHYPRGRYFATSDRAQVIFLDCLFACMSASSGGGATSAQFRKQCDLLATYFESLPLPPNSKRITIPLLFGSKPNPGEQLEQKLRKHLNFQAGLTSFSVYFANSLLFLDVYGCMRFSRQSGSAGSLAQIKQEQQQLRITALKLIAAAAHANGTIEKEESQLYFQFLRSANIPKELSQELREVFRNGITLEEVELPEVSWLVKRYLLEVAMLTIMSDKDVSSEEEEFLVRLCGRLSLETEDLEQGMAALQTFLIVNEPRLHFFKDQSRFLFANDKLKERLARLISLNKDRILQEIHSHRDVAALLQKSHESSLTSDEKHKVKQQLYDILKSIPALTMMLVPGKSLIMPFLLKVMPPDIYSHPVHE